MGIVIDFTSVKNAAHPYEGLPADILVAFGIDEIDELDPHHVLSEADIFRAGMAAADLEISGDGCGGGIRASIDPVLRARTLAVAQWMLKAAVAAEEYGPRAGIMILYNAGVRWDTCMARANAYVERG